MTERTLSYSPIIFVILIAYIKTKSYFVERGIFLAELDIHWPDIKNYLYVFHVRFIRLGQICRKQTAYMHDNMP
jgi:hypothetical protein